MAGTLQRQRDLRRRLVPVLIGRGNPPLSELQASVLVAAALDCFNIANELWVASGGHVPVSTLAADAFDTFEGGAGLPGRP